MLILGRHRRQRRIRKGAPKKAKENRNSWNSLFPVYVIVPAGLLSEREELEKIRIAIRAPDDPDDTAQKRRDRGEAQAARGMLSWTDLNKQGLIAWKEAIWKCLEDGESKTFHRIMIEVCDRPANMCFGYNPEWALWDLVYAKIVEWQDVVDKHSYIVFRRCDSQSKDGPVQSLEDPRIQIFGLEIPNQTKRVSIAIWSGGQTGVDRGALNFAIEDKGRRWGGWAPKGWIDEHGAIPEVYRERMREDNSKWNLSKAQAYRRRTQQNIQDSDGTLILVRNERQLTSSRGTLLTKNYCEEVRRPLIIVELDVKLAWPSMAMKVRRWLKQQRVEVLNVAGPRESRARGIQQDTADFLRQVFLKESSNE